MTDGLLDLWQPTRDTLSWQIEGTDDRWNLYRGTLQDLTTGSPYVQPSGTTPLATRWCDLFSPTFDDPTTPEPGQVAYYLVGASPGGSLGHDGQGVERSNAGGCN